MNSKSDPEEADNDGADDSETNDDGSDADSNDGSDEEDTDSSTTSDAEVAHGGDDGNEEKDAIDAPSQATSTRKYTAQNFIRRAGRSSNAGTFDGTGSDVEWSFASGTLTLSVGGSATNVTVIESANDLPWKDSISYERITRIVVDPRIIALDLHNWFQGYSATVSIDFTGASLGVSGVTFNTSSVSNFENMFYGCTNLQSLTGISGWDTSKGESFRSMFKNCSSLTALDLSGWNTQNASDLDDMFSGLSNLESLETSKDLVLAGTGFGDTASRGETAGTWVSGDNEYSSSDLTTIYAKGSTSATTGAYTFAYRSYFASNKSRNVRWSFDKGSGALSIYVKDANGTKDVHEAAADLPWLASVDYKTITSVTVTGGVETETLEDWFRGYLDLNSFYGSGFDVKNTTSFANLFYGSPNLATVDLTGWVMLKDASRNFMFGGCGSLTTITLAPGVILTSTGLDNTLSLRGPLAGSWDLKDGVWFGTSSNLAARYPEATNATHDAIGTHTYIYVWHGNQIGGRFENDLAWWRYSDGTLTLGADAADAQVTETKDAQPWVSDGTTTIIAKSSITNVKSQKFVSGTDEFASIAPVNFSGWFGVANGYSYLSSFDGSGMSIAHVASFADLFKNVTSLTTVNLTGWAMPTDATRTGMFDGLSALKTLSLSDGVILTNSGLDDTLTVHTPNDGSWQTSDKVWFGSSANLAARYPVANAADSPTEDLVYVWSSGMRSGRFVSNDNAWWKYDDGTLSIGITDAGKRKDVSETPDAADSANRLPWLNVMTNTNSITAIIISGGIAPRDLEGWFAGYANLISFDGEGLDVSGTDNKSLARLFANCVNLTSVRNIDGWDVSGIESLSGIFDGCSGMVTMPVVSGWSTKTGNVRDFSFAFRNTSNVTELKQVAQWDVHSATTFEQMFFGDKYATVLDLSGWHMPAGAKRTGMLGGMGYLRTLSVNQYVILDDTQVDQIESRGVTKGSWDRTDQSTTDPWFGTTANLVARYPQGTGDAAGSKVAGTAVYEWADSSLRGRFANDNAWWKYFGGTKQLVLGSDFDDADHSVVVDETSGYGQDSSAAGIQPWLAVIEGGNARNNVASIVVEKPLQPSNPKDWFRGYAGITQFIGTGLRVADGADLTYLFADDYRLTTVQGLDGWDVSTVSSLEGMFHNDYSLASVQGTTDWRTTALRSLRAMFEITDEVKAQAAKTGKTPALSSLTGIGGWDVSHVADFRDFLHNQTALATLSLAGWDMRANASRTDDGSTATVDVAPDLTGFFLGCTALGKLTLGPDVVLPGTGILGADILGVRGVTQGSWATEGATWFGSTQNLVDRYPAVKTLEDGTADDGTSGHKLPTSAITYSWGSTLRGRFASNDNAWWSFSGSTLTVGTGSDTGSTYLYISERQTDATPIPWLAAIGGESRIQTVATDAAKKFQVSDDAGWFRGYTQLRTIDGQGLDTSNLTTLSRMFAGIGRLTTVKGLADWDVSHITSMAGMFSGDSSLATVTGFAAWGASDGAAAKTGALTDLSTMFYGCKSLTALTDWAQWDVSHVTDFSDLLNGCSGLKTLDLSGWDMSGSVAPATPVDGVTYSRSGMLAGLSSLTTAKFGPKVILADTGFDTLANHTVNQGSWGTEGDAWYGSSANVARRYPTAKTDTAELTLPTATETYTWGSALRGRFTNDNAWWSYASSTLTIGADSLANKTVTELAADQPWRKVTSLYTGGTFSPIVTVRFSGNVAPKNLASWFANYGFLQHFYGDGADVSATISFASLWSGDVRLTNVDISSWDMTANKNRVAVGSPVSDSDITPSTSNMFSANVGTSGSGLSSLVLGPGSVLGYATGDGGYTSGLDSIINRQPTQGRWLLTSGGSPVWWDCGRELELRYGTPAEVQARYGATATRPTDAKLTYTWDGTTLGGRFLSNQSAWWTFVPASGSVSSASTKGTLTVGADTDAAEKHVEEYASDDGTGLPWITALGGVARLDRVTAVTSEGGIAPRSLRGWFQDMTNLASFDGQGIDPADATSFAHLFSGDVRLAVVSNINWSTDQVTDFSYAFANCVALTTLELNRWDVMAATDLSHMIEMDESHRDATKLETLNLTGWNMRTSADRPKLDVTDMLSGLKQLRYLYVHDNVVLMGTGLDNEMYYHTPSDGSWSAVPGSKDKADLVGNTLSLAQRYPDGDHTSYHTATYQFYPQVFKGIFTDRPNVWWLYDEGTISVGLYVKDAPRAENTVTDYDDGTGAHRMPWRDLITDPNPKDLTASGATPVYRFTSSAADGVVVVANMQGWFDGYTLLTSFDGSGLDLSEAVSMANVFRNDTALTSVTGLGAAGKPGAALTSLAYAFGSTGTAKMGITTLSDTVGWDTSNVDSFEGTFRNVSGITALDLTGWTMKPTATRTDMLAGCTGLRTLTLSGGASGGAILDETGFGDSLSTLGNTDGMWVQYANADGTGDELWFDTTSRLAARYGVVDGTRTADTNAALAGTLVYRWDATRLGGRFPSNENAWWKYTKDTKSANYGTLELGTDGGTSGAKYVYENAAAGTLPWTLVGIGGSGKALPVKKVTTMGHLAPAAQGEDGPTVGGDLSAWFKDYNQLTSADLSGLNTQYVTTLAHLFDGATVLSSVTFTTAEGVNEWDTSHVTSMQAMFKGTAALKTLPSLSFLETGEVTDFSSMFEGVSGVQYISGISHWDTGKALTFESMFRGDKALLQLDLEDWQVDAADNVTNLFDGCYLLDKITLGKKFTATQTKQPSRDYVFHFYVNQQWGDGNQYYNGINFQTYRIYYPWASQITIYFANGLQTESTSYDWIYILDQNGTDISGRLGGTAWDYRGKFVINGNQAWIGFRSDGSVPGYGADITVTVTSTGTWNEGTSGWLGGWDELMASNDEYGAPTMAGTYVWNRGSVGGRFASNRKAWWTYDRDTKELVLHGTGTATDSVVTEGKDEQPWRSWPNLAVHTVATKVTTVGNLAPANFAGWFDGYSALVTFDGSGLAISSALSYTDTKHTLDTSDDVAATASVTSLENLFANDAALTSVAGIGEWDVSAVTSLKNLFYNDTKLATVTSVSGWDTSRVTAYDYAFYNNVLRTSLDDVSGWTICTTGDVTMAHLFDGTRVTNLERIASWDVRRVTDLTAAFANNPSLTDASSIGAEGAWAIVGAVKLDSLFAQDTALEKVDLRHWDMKSGATYANLLQNDHSLQTIGLSTTSALGGTGFTNDLTGRGIKDGMWGRENREWYDSTTKLAESYPAGSALYEGSWLYTWQADLPGGHFVQKREVVTGTDGTTSVVATDNPYVWWRFIADTDADGKALLTGTLAIGFDVPTGVSDPDLTVINTDTELPWLSLLSGTNAKTITRVTISGAIRIINPQRWFKNTNGRYGSLAGFSGGALDFSHVGDEYVAADGTTKQSDRSLESFLEGCSALTSVDGVGQWLAAGHITSLRHLFADCVKLESIDGIQDWKTSVGSVTDMAGLFKGAKKLSDLSYLINWNVSNVTDFSDMFNGATALTNLDYITNWKTGAAQKMAGMFAGDTQLTDVDLSGWDVTNVTDYRQMFYGASGVKTLDIGTWDMRQGTDFTNMFYGMTSLSAVVLGQNVILKAGDAITSGMSGAGIANHRAQDGRWQLRGGLWFDSTDNLARRYGSTATRPATESTYDWKAGVLGGHFLNEGSESAWWEYDTASKTLTLGIDDGLDYGAAGEPKRTVSETSAQVPWTTVANAGNVQRVVAQRQIAPLNPKSWFEGYSAITELKIGAMDLTHATDASRMFFGTTRLATLTDMTGWDLTGVENLSYMFYNADALTSLDGFKGWHTQTVKNFSHMFNHASALANTTGANAWDVTAATDLTYMFANCANLLTADIRGWDLRTRGEGDAAVTPSIANMWQNDSKIGTLSGSTQGRLVLGKNSVLAGARLGTFGTYADTRGRWCLPDDTWFGSTSTMESRYGTAGNTLDAPLYYTWDAARLGGRFSNENAWWTYTLASQTLTIGTDSGTDKTITEDADHLPWASVPGRSNASQKIATIDTVGAPVLAKPAGWFAGYDYLTTFDGTNLQIADGVTDLSRLFADNPLLSTIRGVDGLHTGSVTTLAGLLQGDTSLKNNDALTGWDTSSVTNFSDLFNGCTGLTSVNLAAWDMSKVADAEGVARMLVGCTSLASILLDNDSVLTGSGLDNSLKGRASSDGRWVLGRQNADGSWAYSRSALHNTWWGSSLALSGIYKVGGNDRGTDQLYTWDSGTLGGRFSDERAWWTYVKSTRTLDIGTQDDSRIEVSETYDQLPWLGAVTLADVDAITSHGQVVLPEDASQWFASAPYGTKEILSDSQRGWSGWSSSNGTYASLAGDGTVTINPVGGWEIIYTTVSLEQGKTYALSLEWQMQRAGSGSIIIDVNKWYGGWGTGAYYDTYRQGGSANYIAIPAKVTDRFAYGTISFTPSATGMYYVIINGGGLADGKGVNVVQLRNISLVEDPGYVNLASFNGGGLDTSRVTDASQLFAGDAKLSTLAGVVGWDTAAVKNLTGAFAGCRALANAGQLATWNTGNVTNLSQLFEYCTSLQNNDAVVGWDTSKVTDFSRMFYGDTALTKLDLSEWSMNRDPSASVEKMIGVDASAGDHMALATIVASPDSVLEGTGLDDTLVDRTPGDGMWRLTNAPAGTTWFDRSSRLASRYPLATTSTHAGALTYVWDPDYRGGRFEADGDTWWTYDADPDSATYGQLKLGTDVKDAQVSMSAIDLPWADNSVVGLDKVTSVAGQGGIVLMNPASWFAGYKNLTSFNGSGMDVKESTDLSELWAGDAALETLRGVDTWNTSKAQKMNDMFRGCVKLGDDDMAGLENWATDDATTMARMFEGCTGITSLSPLARWKTGNVTDFSSMFEGCTGITDQTPIAGWTVSNADLSRMFAGCTALARADFSGWDMTGCTVKEMLDGDAALEHVKAGKQTVLDGTGLSDDLSGKSVNDGSWKRDTSDNGNAAWADSTSRLAGLYPAAGNVTVDACWYDWEPTLRGRFDSNQHVWWEYDRDTKTLTIGYDGVEGGDNHVDETAERLPWRSLAPPAGYTDAYQHVMEHVVFESDVRVDNPASWFAGHDALLTVEATHLRTNKATSLASMFAGCTSLTSVTGTEKWNPANVTNFNEVFKDTKISELDLTGWTATGKTGVTATDMLSGMNELVTLTLEPGALLTGSGLDDADKTPKRALYAGVWKSGSTTGPDVAAAGGHDAGSSAALVAHYGATGDIAATTTYHWVLENQFLSNPDAWWRFDPDTSTLTIGVKTKAEGNTHGFAVTEYGTYGDHQSDLPWAKSLDPALVKHVVMKNGIAPANLSAWFAGYANLESFDGSGVGGGADVSATTSFADLFRGSFLSSEGTGTVDIHTWDMTGERTLSTSTDAETGETVATTGTPALDGMFAGTKLTGITLGTKSVLDGTGFAAGMVDRTGASGMWRTDGAAGSVQKDAWYDTTAHLATRYAAGGNGLGDQVTYTWVPGKGGLFAGNDNAWWAYDNATRTMWIGAGPGTDKSVTVGVSEQYVRSWNDPIGYPDNTKDNAYVYRSQAPWFGVLSAGSVDTVVTSGGLAPTSMRAWFSGMYVLNEYDRGLYEWARLGGYQTGTTTTTVPRVPTRRSSSSRTRSRH